MKSNIQIASINDFESVLSPLKANWDKVYVLVDENTKEHCLPVLFANMDFFTDAEIIEIESGEETKSIEVCTQIWEMMLVTGATRNSVLVNLGGGVICDLGGFIASTFKRGIDFINIPTTLLAQVDASIGGKTGINICGVKNQVGLFSEAKLTFIDEHFLTTQDKRNFNSGIGEVLKYGLISDKRLYTKASSLDIFSIDLKEIITLCIGIKQDIVSRDYKENGERKKLNFGHTIGHALESFFEQTVLHGEAIGAGMICEAFLSHKLNGLSETELLEIKETVNHFFVKLNFTEKNFDEFIDFMKMDKKNSEEGINFTLLKSIGEASVNYVIDEETIKESLMYYLR
jgi:3-dehydroquinate synthase